MKIFAKLFKMFLFVIIAPLLITAIFLFYYQQYAKEELLENYLNIAEISAFSLENNAITLSQNISALLNSQPLEQENILQNQILQNNDILMISLFSTEGKEIARVKKVDFENLPIMDISQNQKLKNISTGAIKVNYPADIFPPYTAISSKLSNGNILFIVVDFANYITQTELHKIGKSGGFYFLDKYGYYILNRGSIPLLNLSMLHLNKKGIISNLKAQGLTLAGAYVKNPIGEGYLFLLQNQKEAFYTINLITWLIIFFVLATTTLSYFASLYFSEDLAEPIDKLIDAAHEIEKNNFSITIDENKYMKEFAPLIKNFNSMTVKLKEYQEVQLDKLLEERNKVNLLARLMRDGIVMCTLEGKELFTNQVAKYILNSDAFYKNLEATIRDKYLNEPSLKKLLKVPNGSIFHYVKDNHQIYFEVINEIFSPQNEEAVAIILFRDITSEHEISEIKNDVFNAIAHDLRAPILGIQGYVMLLEEETLTKEEQKQMLRAISNSSKMLVGLVENILDISKLERGLLVLNQTIFDLYKTLQDLSTSLLPTAEQKGLEIKITSTEPTPIFADKNLIERLFSNLISNAIKFTSKGGVYIKIKQENENYLITIKDTGIGISKEELPQIFEKYHQADRNVRGYGLGLTIVKQIVDAHKGTIEVNSELNEGTVFSISLPLNLKQEIAKQ